MTTRFKSASLIRASLIRHHKSNQTFLRILAQLSDAELLEKLAEHSAASLSEPVVLPASAGLSQ
jgi:hypothetical protein